MILRSNYYIIGSVTKLRVILTLITILIVGSLATGILLYAKGYRLEEGRLRLSLEGLMVVKSDPDGAQIFINGELEGATNSNLSLSSGTYDVSVRKEGFQNWEKRLTVEKEVVTQIEAVLFPSAPSLSALTFDGVENPVVTSDISKVAFEVPASPENLNSQGEPERKSGLWVVELVNLPIGFSSEPRQITDTDLTDASWIFSPDNRQVLLTTKQGVFLLDAGDFTPQNELVNIASRKENLLLDWEEERKLKLESQLKRLPEKLSDILQRKSSSIVFSPDEKKVLYTASGNETVPDGLIPPLPGASTQRQERNIKEGQTYLYDIKEDRNFLVSSEPVKLDINKYLSDNNGVDTSKKALHWFPTSSHLVLAESDRVSIMDYDGTNSQTVYSGSYQSPHVFPFSNRARMLILTNLGASSTPTNLYSLTLK